LRPAHSVKKRANASEREKIRVTSVHSNQVEGHRKLLDIQEVYLKAHDNLDQTNVAKLAHGMIKEHLTLLADMEKVGG
jgi:hypothetical protein